jgi:hypothetical protein
VKQLFLAIKGQLETEVPSIQFIQMYNRQFDLIDQGEGGSLIYSFPFPCVFVEFVSPSPIKQLGGGYQIYDPLLVNIHIGHELYDAGDGSMEQNLDVFDLRTLVYKALQKFEPSGAVAFMRTEETQDTNHKAIYHFIQEYTTNYIDNGMAEPVGGVTKDPPTDLDLTVGYNPSPYTKKL